MNKGVAHGKADRPDEEIAAYDEVVRRFGDAQEPALREQVAKALVNKGVAHGKADRPDEAIIAYDEVVRRFGDAQEPALRVLVAKAQKLIADTRAHSDNTHGET
jgi:tetratricopeptide (TPR) repeat protein